MEKRKFPMFSRYMSSRQKTFLIGLALAGLIVVSIFIIKLIIEIFSPCSGIFEQTAPKAEVSLETIKNKGAIAVSQAKIQELSDEAQKVGMHLKTCCIVRHNEELDATQFQQCMDKASGYEKQITLTAQQVEEAAELIERGAVEVPPEMSTRINQSIQAAANYSESLARQVAAIQSPNKEKEPNDQITEPNVIQLGAITHGVITSNKDRDYFKFKTSNREPNRVRIFVRKPLAGGFMVDVTVYDQVENSVAFGSAGGDDTLSLAFKSTPNSDYYILVKGLTLFDDQSNPYDLQVREE
jgi:hypothetical protein